MDLSGELNDLLNGKEYVRASALLLRAAGTVYAATTGLDGRPQVRPAAFAFEEEGAFYFLTLKSRRIYAELSKTPYVQFCTNDEEHGITFRLSGKVCFTEDNDLIVRAAKACPEMLKSAGGDPKMLIAFFLLGAEALIGTDECERKLPLPDPAGVLIGVTIKKKPELRDRIVKILERREAEPPKIGTDALKSYDGALFVFADAAKAIWPRMDIRPIERAAVFETYDERERYVDRAAFIIGNAVINYPEDITFWLDPARWTAEK